MINLTYSLLFSIFSGFLTPLSSGDNHEYYFSNMTMERNLENQTLEVEFRLFSNDLELALGESDDYHLRLGDDREDLNADSLIFEYLFKKVKIEGDGWDNASVTYIGKKVDHDITYVYIEYGDITNWGEVTITNSIFFELFPDQSNQLSFINGKKIKTLSSIKNYPQRTINFSE